LPSVGLYICFSHVAYRKRLYTDIPSNVPLGLFFVLGDMVYLTLWVRPTNYTTSYSTSMETRPRPYASISYRFRVIALLELEVDLPICMRFLARDVILYILCLCYDVSVRLSVRLYVCDGSALAHYS